MTRLLFMGLFFLLCLYKTSQVNFGENTFSPHKLSINIQRENVPRAKRIPGRKSTLQVILERISLSRAVRVDIFYHEFTSRFLGCSITKIFLLERGHTLSLCKWNYCMNTSQTVPWAPWDKGNQIFSGVTIFLIERIYKSWQFGTTTW